MEGLRPITARNRLADEAYAVLREAILDGQLQAGEPLSVSALAGRLAISRSPVREAILRLQRDGLVQDQHYRSAVVTKSSMTDLRELYELREVLEGLAARLAATKRTPQQLERLRELLGLHSHVVEQANIENHIAMDLSFHELVCEIAGNSRVRKGIAGIKAEIQLAIRSTAAVPGNPSLALEDHGRIFQAIASGDADGSEAAARGHVSRLRRSLSIEEPVNGRTPPAIPMPRGD